MNMFLTPLQFHETMNKNNHDRFTRILPTILPLLMYLIFKIVYCALILSCSCNLVYRALVLLGYGILCSRCIVYCALVLQCIVLSRSRALVIQCIMLSCYQAMVHCALVLQCIFLSLYSVLCSRALVLSCSRYMVQVNRQWWLFAAFVLSWGTVFVKRAMQ